MKTIKQIADEIGVSKQAVHQKRKSKGLATALQPFTSTVDGVVYISVDGEILIRQAFSASGRKIIDVNEPQTTEALITMLQNELAAKNKLLDEQQQTINKLTDTVKAQAEGLAAAQQSTQAAQFLHAGTIQQQLTDGGGSTAEPVAPPMGFIERVKFVFSKPNNVK